MFFPVNPSILAAAGPDILFVQATAAARSNNNTSITSGAIDTTTGNTLFVLVGYYKDQGLMAIDTLTDNDGHVLTDFTADALAASNLNFEAAVLYRRTNITGKAGLTHTCTITGSGLALVSIQVLEFSGLAASPLDATAAGAETSSGSHSSGALAAPSQNKEVAIALGVTAVSAGTSAGPSAPWVTTANTVDGLTRLDLVAGYKIFSDGAAQTFNWTTSSATARACTLIAGYKGATP